MIVRLAVVAYCLFMGVVCAQVRSNVPRVGARVAFNAKGTRMPGDMCTWIHPDESKRNLSVVITSDPKAQMLSVFDIEGGLIDALRVPMPGDVDVRYNFPLTKDTNVDIIAVVQRRNGNRVLIFAIDPTTRKLRRLDNDKIFCGTESEGGCLYVNLKTKQYYFFSAGSNGVLTQIELVADGSGQISGKRLPKRLTMYSDCRAAVADDYHGVLYVSEKSHGVWKYDANPLGNSKGTLIAKIGDNGLLKDIEGLGLYHVNGGHGYLVICSEGSNRFLVFDREKNNYLGSFVVRGAKNSRYMDICAADMGMWYSKGMFLCNTEDKSGRTRVIAVPWESIASGFEPKGLGATNMWSPRKVRAPKRPSKRSNK